MAYFPMDQKPANQLNTVTNLDVRVAGAADAIEPALRERLRGTDPTLLVGDIGAMSNRLSRDLTRERLAAYLALGFGGLTLLLAALGLYGLLSYAVTLRTQEIGVRMALGAHRVAVIRLVGGQSAVLAAAGMMLGLLAATAGARYLSTLLFGVAALDPWTFVLVVLAMAGVTTLASYLPARRAANLDPLVALRHQ
jgi:ABC-type lipoprotein release transport system permease subunit